LKGTWEILVTGIVPYDYYSNILDGEIFTYSKVIKIISLGNLGPPIFLSELQEQNLLLDGKTKSYKYVLPKIKDPDDDEYNIHFNINKANSFTFFDRKTMTLTFKPKLKYIGAYHGLVILQDRNLYPLKSTYKFLILVLPPIISDDPNSMFFDFNITLNITKVLNTG
jgi:hypothetical protein